MQPETIIRNALLTYLRARGWFVEIFYCNRFQKGIPDLGMWHPTHGFRWVDVKQPVDYDFTDAQLKKWPQWEATGLPGLGVWILTAATDEEYLKLFGPPNWRTYLRGRHVRRGNKSTIS